MSTEGHLGIDFNLAGGIPDSAVTQAAAHLFRQAEKRGWKAARREVRDVQDNVLSMDIIRDDEAGEPVDERSLIDWALSIARAAP